MFTPIEPNDKLANKILKQITDLIKAGELNPGDKLPPERQLAELMGVGRPALKQTISILEAMGIVESRQGDGNYILPYQDKIFNPIVLSFYAAHGNMDDILEVRYILELNNAKLLVKKINDEQIDELYAIVERMKGKKNLQERIAINNEFHTALIRMGNNPLIINFYNSIIELIAEQISTTDGSNYYNSHKEIVDSLKTRDADLVARVMSKHFTAKFPNYKYYEAIYK